MKKCIVFLALVICVNLGIAQDWEGIMVPPSPGSGMVWELQENVSDDFNYDSPPALWVDTIGGKWINWYHNDWTGPPPTIWRRDHSYVEDGKLHIIASRTPGDSMWVDGQLLAVTNAGIVHSKDQIVYPVYLEARVKVMNSVLASNVWMLSSDDTQEIDASEIWGGERWNNTLFSEKRAHLSHHVFIREPFQDWQPSDEGSFYTDGETVWREDFHRFGVYWKDSVNLEYYVNGELVRTRSGMEEIDPVFYTNLIDPGDPTNDTRTGLNKPMDIILDAEDHTWRAVQGLTPTQEEIENLEDHTYRLDWIRVYKPIPGEVGPVTSVSINPDSVTTYVGNQVMLTANVVPYNANDLSVNWESLQPDIASVNSEGVVETLAEGTAQIVVTTSENNKKDTCYLFISGVPPSLEFLNEFTYLNFDYPVGGNITVECEFHAGSGNTLVEGGLGGMKFWLREITPGWGVANDYITSDSSVIGMESGTATGVISLENVPPTSEIPTDNWYFLYVQFQNSEGELFDAGIWPINIVDPTSVFAPDVKRLEAFPNPTQSVLNIKGEHFSVDYTIDIATTDGRLIAAPLLNADRTNLQIDINRLPKGLYVARVIDEGKTYLVPFVKQ